MLKRTLRLALCAVSLAFVSCASSKVAEDAAKIGSVYVTNRAVFNLLPPFCTESESEGSWQMNAVFGGHSYDFLVYAVADSSVLSMILFGEFGSTLGTLEYNGEAIFFESSVLPENLKAEYIVADFQFCLYDFEKVRDELSKSSLDFVREQTADGETRKILSKGKLVSLVTKSARLIKYENFLRGYSYTLTALDSESEEADLTSETTATEPESVTAGTDRTTAGAGGTTAGTDRTTATAGGTTSVTDSADATAGADRTTATAGTDGATATAGADSAEDESSSR